MEIFPSDPIKRKKFLWESTLVIGLIFQEVYQLFREKVDISILPLLVGLAILGTVLIIVGCWKYIETKGYHGAFGLLGLLSIIGVAIIFLLPDKTKKVQTINK